MQESDQYQQMMNLDSQKEDNRRLQAMQKATIDRERIAAQRDVANTQLRIAQENKNKYDLAKKNKPDDKKSKK
jgi:hypothetical protein